MSPIPPPNPVEAREFALWASDHARGERVEAAAAFALVAIALVLTSGRPLQVEVRGDVTRWEPPA